MGVLLAACAPRPPGCTDLEGNTVDPLSAPAVATVLVFIQTECPISNRHAPEIQRLRREYEPKGARFWVVYPDPDDDAAAVRRHREAYGYTGNAVLDPGHALVARAGASVMPEAAVFAGGELVYRGRISDLNPAFGMTRASPGSHDLEDALRAVLAGHEPPVARTRAVGCYIQDLRG